jgi:membrane-associated phospholipid phosphatase
MRVNLRNPSPAARRARTLPRWVGRIDRAASGRINASRSWHVHDRAYSLLSRAGDHGVLWYAVAGGLVMLGRPHAAARGLGSMLTAAFLSDVVVKSFFDGRRPLLDDVPGIRRLRAYPGNPSFPSGHSASAAAFATGVALESGPAGLVIAPAGSSFPRASGGRWPRRSSRSSISSSCRPHPTAPGC